MSSEGICVRIFNAFASSLYHVMLMKLKAVWTPFSLHSNLWVDNFKNVLSLVYHDNWWWKECVSEHLHELVYSNELIWLNKSNKTVTFFPLPFFLLFLFLSFIISILTFNLLISLFFLSFFSLNLLFFLSIIYSFFAFSLFSLNLNLYYSFFSLLFSFFSLFFFL